MAAPVRHRWATGVDHDTSLQLDALLESVQDPFWNGMGGADDGMSVPAEADLEEIYGDDASAALVSDILDRVDALVRRHAELACGAITSTRCRPAPGGRAAYLRLWHAQAPGDRQTVCTRAGLRRPQRHTGDGLPGRVIHAARKGFMAT